MGHVLASPLLYVGQSFTNAAGNAECVEFIKQTLNSPLAKNWTQGAPILKLAPGQADPTPIGTAIATFVNGKYPPANGHAAIYMGQNALGIQVLDQWNTKPNVSPRTIFWTHGSATNLVDNGKAYSVINW